MLGRACVYPLCIHGIDCYVGNHDTGKPDVGGTPALGGVDRLEDTLTLGGDVERRGRPRIDGEVNRRYRGVTPVGLPPRESAVRGLEHASVRSEKVDVGWVDRVDDDLLDPAA